VACDVIMWLVMWLCGLWCDYVACDVIMWAPNAVAMD